MILLFGTIPGKHLLKSNRILGERIQHTMRFVANWWIMLLFTNRLQNLLSYKLSSHFRNIGVATHVRIDCGGQHSDNNHPMIRQIGS